MSGVSEVVSRYNTSGKVALRFEVDTSGLLHLERAESTVEVETMEEKVVEVPVVGDGPGAANGTENATTANVVADGGGAANDTVAGNDGDKSESDSSPEVGAIG